ncbi:MAG: ribonuclease H family protein [Finegoldia sp.]|nr:ribonuclease H family protein [Finegoldia sp.]
MAKYYAVKNGRRPGIYTSWDECKAQVDGYKNAIFKSFKTKGEALDFLGEKTKQVEEKKDLGDNEAIAYVDGSYKKDSQEYGYGCVFIYKDRIEKFKEKFPQSAYSSHRNVSGEISGSIFAIKKALELGLSKINIYYDYQGVASWALGEWKTNTELTKLYKKFIDQVKDQIEINFIKVKAHSNDKYNDLADSLAKEALGIK